MTKRTLAATVLVATLGLGVTLAACEEDDGASVRQLEDEGTGSPTGGGGTTGTGSPTGGGGTTGTGSPTGGGGATGADSPSPADGEDGDGTTTSSVTGTEGGQ